jgi:nucleolin
VAAELMAAAGGGAARGEEQEKEVAALKQGLKAAKKAFKAKPEDPGLKAAFNETKAQLAAAQAAAKKSAGSGAGAAAAEAAAPGCTVFVGNLDWEVRDSGGEAVGEMLREMLDGCTVRSIKWGADRHTGKFAGYCHVLCATPADAKRALKLAGAELCGRPMKVDAAEDVGVAASRMAMGKAKWAPPAAAAANPTSEVRCFVGNLEFSLGNEAELKLEFAKVGAALKEAYIPTDKVGGSCKHTVSVGTSYIS